MGLQAPQAGDIYFQAVIMPVKADTADQLLKLRNLAEDSTNVPSTILFPASFAYV